MERVKAFFGSLYWAALSVTAFPALALAQGATTGRAPSTGGGAAPAGGAGVPTDGGAGGAGWLWIVAALAVLAIIWWMMSSRRRRDTLTR